MLTPPKRAAHLVMFKISIHFCRSRSEKLNRNLNGRKLIFRLNGRRPNSIFQRSKSNWCFFRILKFSGPSLPGMTSSTLLWEPYPSYHNGLFSLLLVRKDFAARGRSISVLSEQSETSYFFYITLSFLCNIICYLISVFVFSLVTLSEATTHTPAPFPVRGSIMTNECHILCARA